MAHDFGTKSSVLHLDRGVPLPDTKSPMANTSAVWSCCVFNLMGDALRDVLDPKEVQK